VPARFASLAAKLRNRATDPTRARLTTTTPCLPMQPARERHAEPNAPVPVGDRIKEGTPTEPQRVPPMMAAHHAPIPETTRKVVTDVPMPGAKPAAAPRSELPEQHTPKLVQRQAGAPATAVVPEAASRNVTAAATVPSSSADATPLSVDDAR